MGRAIALRLAGEGAHVFGCGRNRDELDATATQIADAGGRFTGVRIDLAEPGAARTFVQQAAASGRLDALINNAAIIDVSPIASGDMETWRRMAAINLFAVVEGCQAAIQSMRAGGRPGWLVNISSLASRMEGMGVYGATKAAVNSLGQSLRLELERDPIRITTIIPGAFATNLGRDMDPATRARFMAEIAKKGVAPDADGRAAFMGLPDDIARAVTFVLSQPPGLNIPELIVRPQMDLTIPME
jgi:NAD(P)-dependent dehydrogenase (short-subunit alcohol dehydrogenase family)